jgi:hypothetical protein
LQNSNPENIYPDNIDTQYTNDLALTPTSGIISRIRLCWVGASAPTLKLLERGRPLAPEGI